MEQEGGARAVTLEPGSVVGADEFRAVHTDFYKGIYVPAGTDVAVSIRFRPGPNEDWGYADRWVDVGRVLDYTGQGGPPASQSWNRYNTGLLRAIELQAPVHVFEVLPVSPRRYKYWGHWLVSRWYEQFAESQRRSVLRFVLKAPGE